MQSATGYPHDRLSEGVLSPTEHIVSICSDVSDFERLRSEWESLRKPGEDQDPFLSCDWFTAWWQVFGGCHKLCLITARRHGRLRAVLPMILRRTWFHGIPVRRLGAMENDHSPYFDLVRTDDDNDLYQAIWNCLMAQASDWDVLDFPRIGADSATSEQFVRLAGQQKVRYSVWQSPTGSPWITLQSSWDAYLRSRSTSFRKALGRKMRRLAERGKVRLETVTDGEQLEQGLADALRIEAEGWKGRGGTAIASQPAVKGFYSRLAESMASLGQLRLHFLSLDGERIAFDYSIIANRCLYSLKAGHANAHARHSPGTLLLGLIVEQAHAQRLRGIDLMGEADEFKMHWTDVTRTHPWLHCYSSSFRGRLIHALKAKRANHYSIAVEARS